MALRWWTFAGFALLFLLGLARLRGLAEAAPAASKTGRVVSQRLFAPGATPAAGQVLVEDILSDSIPGVSTRAVTLSGPAAWVQEQGRDENFVLLFLGGQGSFLANETAFEIDGETIARAPVGFRLEVRAPAGRTLTLLAVRKQLSSADHEDLLRYPQNNQSPWVRRFRDCEAYREKIKSPKTISRTLLPANHLPRVAIGTVETTGPDAVGAHAHPMLEQLFLGLRTNEITVTADGAEAPLGELELLVIPHASNHGARVAKGRTLHYVWMDFFSDKEGQSWLDEHKPIPAGEDPRTPAPRP